MLYPALPPFHLARLMHLVNRSTVSTKGLSFLITTVITVFSALGGPLIVAFFFPEPAKNDSNESPTVFGSNYALLSGNFLATLILLWIATRSKLKKKYDRFYHSVMPICSACYYLVFLNYALDGVLFASQYRSVTAMYTASLSLTIGPNVILFFVEKILHYKTYTIYSDFTSPSLDAKISFWATTMLIVSVNPNNILPFPQILSSQTAFTISAVVFVVVGVLSDVLGVSVNVFAPIEFVFFFITRIPRGYPRKVIFRGFPVSRPKRTRTEHKTTTEQNTLFQTTQSSIQSDHNVEKVTEVLRGVDGETARGVLSSLKPDEVASIASSVWDKK